MVDLEIDIGAIVGELRELRESAMAVRRREDQPVKLPSRKVLASVVDGRGSVIGGNVWLTESVAPGSFVTQAHVLGIEYRDGSGI